MSLAKPACMSQWIKRTLERSSRGNWEKWFLRELGFPILDEFLHHGKDNVAGGEGIHSDIMDGSDGTIEPGAYGKEEVREDVEDGLDKVRSDGKRPVIVFTGSAVGTEGDKDAPAGRGGRVADSFGNKSLGG